MSDWTIKVGSGTEVSLAAFGASMDLRLRRVSQAPDICSVSVPVQSMDSALAATYGQSVLIKRDGDIWFAGKAMLPQRLGAAESERIVYKFAGPWWDLERLVFQQSWKTFNDYTTPGDASTPPTFITTKTSEYFLGVASTGLAQNTGAQITEALNWAITCGVGVQIGTIDPATNIVSYNSRDLSVAEVIIQMLRWTPDVITWFDYTTSPPTLHVRKLANLTNVDVTVGTDKIKTIALGPRNDLQLPAVVIHFKSVNDTDGFPWVSITTQKAPGGATGTELGASVSTIELQGSKLTRVSASLVAEPILARSSTEADRIAWWKSKVLWLANDTIDGSSLHITSATILDESDVDVTSTALTDFPNELKKGQIADWMPFSKQTLKIKALATFDSYKDSGHKIKAHCPVEMPIHVTIHATNATTGDYSATEHFGEAEAVPSGLAQDIYDAHSVLRYDGSLELVGDEIPTGLGMGNKLTIIGLAATYSNLFIQETIEEPAWGKITLVLGAPKQIGLSDLIELLRVNRYRRVYNMPSSQSTGKSGGESQVSLGKEVPKQDSTADQTHAQLTAVNMADDEEGNTKAVMLDADNHQVLIQRTVDSTGAQDPDFGSCTIKLSDLEGWDGVLRHAKFQETECCVSGALKRVMVLRTDAYDPRP
jgi:hypothetical protein